MSREPITSVEDPDCFVVLGRKTSKKSNEPDIVIYLTDD